jgi:hypothetical protein
MRLRRIFLEILRSGEGEKFCCTYRIIIPPFQIYFCIYKFFYNCSSFLTSEEFYLMTSLSEKNERSSSVSITKDVILDVFKKQREPLSQIETLVMAFPEMFTNEVLEPEPSNDSLPPDPQDVFISQTIKQPVARFSEKLLKKKIIHRSPFTASGYADTPTVRVWYYVDEMNRIQGPFTSIEMDCWFDNGFFFNELLIRFKENNDFVRLIDLFGKTEPIQPISVLKLLKDKEAEMAAAKNISPLEEHSKPENQAQPEKEETILTDTLREPEVCKIPIGKKISDLSNTKSTCESTKSYNDRMSRLSTPEKVFGSQFFVDSDINVGIAESIEKIDEIPEIEPEGVNSRKSVGSVFEIKISEPFNNPDTNNTLIEQPAVLETQLIKKEKKSKKQKVKFDDDPKQLEEQEIASKKNLEKGQKPSTAKKESDLKKIEKIEPVKKFGQHAIIYVPKPKPKDPSDPADGTKKKKRKKKRKNKKDQIEDKNSKEIQNSDQALFSFVSPFGSTKMGTRSEKSLNPNANEFGSMFSNKQSKEIQEPIIVWPTSNTLNLAKKTNPEINMNWSEDRDPHFDFTKAFKNTSGFNLMDTNSHTDFLQAFEEIQKYKHPSSDEEEDDLEEEEEEFETEVPINTNLKFLDDFSSL